jgi:hypothetical protein
MTAGKTRWPGWGPGDERRLEALLDVRMRRRLYPQEQAEYERLCRRRVDARRVIDLRTPEDVREAVSY